MTLEVLTLDQVRHERSDLVARLPAGEADLRRRGAAYALNADELAILDKLDELDFLLEQGDQ